MNTRIKKLQASLSGIAGAALIFSEENRFYFTGFSSSDGALLVTPSGSVFYTDSRYLEAAENRLGKENVRNSADMYKELQMFFTENGIDTCAVENDRLTLSELEMLERRLPAMRFDVTSALSRSEEELRSIKSQEEVNEITRAQAIAENALDYVLGIIKPGMTEKEIRLELDYYMLKNGAEKPSFDTIAVSGVNSSLPHGIPGMKRIEAGDFITMDFGAVVNGYHSDMTRTVLLGTPTLRQKEVYDTVLSAQLHCLDSLSAGVSCQQADTAARQVIEKAGYGKFFGHATGHGVGIEIHEAPFLSHRSRSVLEAGNLVTAEPGIYLPGKFGVRIEDMALITASGCINLTHFEKELICL